MRLGIPQIIIIAIVLINLGIQLALHGEDYCGKHNFWSALLAAAIELFILYKGGFF